MSVITLPAFETASFRWKLRRNQVVSRSPFGSQGLESSTPLWTVSITGVPMVLRRAIAFETFLESLDGLRNQVAVYNRAQPYPAGTMRGTLALASAAADGALALEIDGGVGQAGFTLLKGDLIGLGSGLTQQVVRVAADATANGSGVITLALNHALRGAFLIASEVRLNKPAALFRQMQDNSGIEYSPGQIGQPWSLDLIEDPRP